MSPIISLGIVYAEKNYLSLDFPDPFQARRLPIGSAKSDFVSCRRRPRAAKKIRVRGGTDKNHQK
jgi:hypothetical protein